MTSETPNLHVSKNLKQDIEELKTPIRLVWKCCSAAEIESRISSLQRLFNKDWVGLSKISRLHLDFIFNTQQN